MDLSGLIDQVSRDPSFAGLGELIASGKKSQGVVWSGVALDSAKPCLVAALRSKLGRPIVVVTPRDSSAVALQEQIALWSATPENVYLFPEPDTLPYEQRAWDPSIALDRIRVLDLLVQHTKDTAP